ncbi:phospholipid phosphatase-related protein type 3 isoform X1 [Anguilla anguilla]|uniref:phospholipid phosphatase-related protein type 3 isoform X1 n=2 Tax=Anguilla anguilla TaxID=7936 RepID=UPI0015AD5631|nr:phospholipid phosphatase-related protein type 3 isoform X1 [Anguilla anguilla]
METASRNMREGRRSGGRMTPNEGRSLLDVTMISSKDKPKKKPPKDSMTLLPCFYFVELPIVASSMVSLYFLELTDLLQPAQVGFRCHDRSLSMPYVDSGDELIPLLMLLSLAFAGPAASIMMGEGLVYCLQSRLKIRPGAEGSINAGGCNFNSFLRRTVRFVGVHVFGLCATALVTDVIQLATGYHTPFFLTVCKPNYTLPGVSCDKNPYITRDICSGQDQHAILSARKTFPSQHATLSAFAAVYISMYFNSTISDSTKLLKPVLVFAFAIAAALTGLTQITQYRSHPIDVYVGFLIGAGIAAYLAFHAVGNFKSSEDAPPKPPLPPQKDALRALTQRGHDSVYHKGHASESNDELSAPQTMEGLNRQVQREKASLGSLKRASVDVELLAPRSPMGKETMVTFSNTLPRTNNCAAEDPGRRHMTIHVPVDPLRSKQLVSEWKQKSMELRGMSLRGDEEEEDSEDGSDTGDDCAEDEAAMPPSLYPTVQASRGVAAAAAAVAAGGHRVAIPPRPGAPQLVHIPEEAAGPPPVSPKSASTRAKWLSITEKSGAAVPAHLRPPNQPRIMQVIAMSKQQGLIGAPPKSSDTSSSCTSSTASAESPLYRPPSERDGASIVTVDAHAPHHPVVHVSSGNGSPWEWKTATNGSAADFHESYELNDLNRDCARSYRSVKSVSPASSASEADLEPPPPPHLDLQPDGRGRDSTLRRKPPLSAQDRDSSQPQTEHDPYYKKLQTSRRYKD